MITKENISKLESLIGQVSSMIEWVSDYTQSSKRLEIMKQLVNCRRGMKRIYYAMIDNPTIAAYGESQMGKSYIISSLLSSQTHPFEVLDDEGNKINFISKINMKGTQQENTGVVTRFTASNVIRNPRYPVKLRLLSISDFITILSDSFMTDIIGYMPYSESDLSGITSKLVEKYRDKKVVQNKLTEDDVADIEEYLKKHRTAPVAVYLNSKYFDVLGTIIRKVPEEEWADVFAPLWKNNETFSKFFSLFVQSYSTMKYAQDVHISIKAVLNDFNDGSPTLMCVRALDGLIDVVESGLHVGTQVEILLPDDTCVNINKSMLSAMTAEVVYKIDESVLDDEVTFDFKGIRPGLGTTAEDNISMLKTNGLGRVLKKDFLNKVDLLDFPGARGRDLGYQAGEIVKQVVNLLLRCKVSYLFTKYSENLKLSILMFCHSHENSTPNLVAPLLRTWVETYIGKDENERMECLEHFGLSPLFLVSTKYNIDLITKEDGIDEKVWERRLGHIWYNEVINHMSNTWFDRWIPNKRFDNTFLLRDYKYSSDITGDCNKLFKGYPGCEEEEYDVEEHASMKNIFLNDPSVRIFFENPELAWDVSSTIGNDGSYYMLSRLAGVSERASEARDRLFNKQLKDLTDKVYNLIRTEFHDDNDSELLEQSVRSARRFHFLLLRACEKRQDFFGRMIQFLQINSNFVASFFSKIIHSQQIVSTTDVQEYEMLVRGVEEQGLHFDPAPSKEAYENNFKILGEVYGILGPDDPMLEGIDPEKLFQSTYKKKCTPSTVLSNSLIDYWKEMLLKPESSIFFTQAGFDGIIFSNFVSNFTNMMDKVNLAQRIADEIKEYVDYSAAVAPENEELVADIATNIYNSFVMNMGYSYLSDEQRQKNSVISEKYKLPKIITDEDITLPVLSDDEQLNLLFDQLEALNEGDGGQLTQLPAYLSMRRWMSFVFMSFTIAYDVANYDEVANRILGKLIDEFSINQDVI